MATQRTVQVDDRIDPLLQRLALHKGWSYSQCVNDALLMWIAHESSRITISGLGENDTQ
jgi:hypothetical protein